MATRGVSPYLTYSVKGASLLPGVAMLRSVAADVELTVVTMAFQAADPEALLGVLAKYVVVSRGAPGCRNIDLCASATHDGRYLVVEKWESPDAQRAHFDSPEMVEMAQACRAVLTASPDIELWSGASAHDLL
jgi:quinol monooxygenase YgiN